MTIREEIFKKLKELVEKQKYEKKDLRTIKGNLENLTNTPRIKDLSLEETETCKKIANFLKEWKENQETWPNIFTRNKEKEIELLTEKFTKWFELAQKKIKTSALRSNSSSGSSSSWETRLKSGQKILSWVEWFEKHEQKLKFGLFIFGLLFAWLIIEKLVEKIK